MKITSEPQESIWPPFSFFLQDNLQFLYGPLSSMHAKDEYVNTLIAEGSDGLKMSASPSFQGFLLGSCFHESVRVIHGRHLHKIDPSRPTFRVSLDKVSLEMVHSLLDKKFIWRNMHVRLFT